MNEDAWTGLADDRRRWDSRQQLRTAIVSWIERTYHRRRRQVQLGRSAPVEFERIMPPLPAWRRKQLSPPCPGPDAGVSQDLLDALRDRARLIEGRRAAPSAGIIDSASVKAAETVGADSRGFNAGKKINGRKRHIAVDTVGLLICVLVTGADVQDRTAARHLLARLKYHCPSVRHLWADSG